MRRPASNLQRMDEDRDHTIGRCCYAPCGTDTLNGRILGVQESVDVFKEALIGVFSLSSFP